MRCWGDSKRLIMQVSMECNGILIQTVLRWIYACFLGLGPPQVVELWFMIPYLVSPDALTDMHKRKAPTVFGTS